MWRASIGIAVLNAVVSAFVGNGAPRPGASVHLEVPTQSIRPIAIALKGPTHLEQAVTVETSYQFENLQSGSYSVEATYVGGIRTPVASFELGTSESRDLAPDFSDIGGIEINLPKSYCVGAFPNLIINKVQLDRAEDEIVASVKVPCVPFRLGGLRPHTYSLGRMDSGLTLPIRRTIVAVQAQRWSQLALAEPAVVVRGVLSGGAAQGSRQELRFAARPGNVAVSVWTDDFGQWATALPAVGSYQIDWLGKGGRSTLAQAEFVAGENSFNLQLNTSTLIVADRALAASGRLFVDNQQTTRSYDIADFRRPFQIDGLPSGSYGIWATSGNKTSDRYTLVRLESGSTVSKELSIIDHSRALVVVDSGGHPVDYLTVDLGSESISLRKLETGRFDISGLPAGAPLVFRTAPEKLLCHVISSESEQTVVMPTVEALTLDFATRTDTDSGFITLASGSDCPIPFQRFRLPRFLKGHYQLRLPTGTPSLVLGRQRFNLQVPGPVVSIR